MTPIKPTKKLRHCSVRPPNFPDAAGKYDASLLPPETPVAIPGKVHVFSGFALPPLPLAILVPNLPARNKEEKESLRAPQTPSEESAIRWKTLREKDFSCRVESKGGRVLAWNRFTEKKKEQVEKKRKSNEPKKPLARVVKKEILKSLANERLLLSDPSQYMVKTFGSKTIWRYTGKTRPITTIGSDDSLPTLPTRITFFSSSRHSVVGPFRQLSLVVARQSAVRDRLLHHALWREYRENLKKKRSMAVKRKWMLEKKGECYSYKRRFRNYVAGMHLCGRSGLREQLMVKKVERTEEEREDGVELKSEKDGKKSQ